MKFFDWFSNFKRPVETYKVYVKCSNCEFEGEIEIPVGISIDDFKCPTCKVSRYYHGTLRLPLFKKDGAS